MFAFALNPFHYTKINRLLNRPIPKLYSKFEVNRIRIAVRIVLKPKGWKKERKKEEEEEEEEEETWAFHKSGSQY